MRKTWRMPVLVPAVLVAGAVLAAEPAAKTVVTVDPTRDLGPIKPMHATNNGPWPEIAEGNQMRSNIEEFRAAGIPFARTHDSVNCVSGGARTCDISAVFPDFAADEDDPKNYDFVFTDHYLDTIRRAGSQVFFRLGQTIEHGPKKYGALPPPDYAKWARICEHVVRHYNEGWGWASDEAYTTKNIAWSNQFGIVYWEIWNEPDFGKKYVGRDRNPRCWGGTVTNFFEFYTTAAKHLKAKHPKIKVGGPSLLGFPDWCENFLAYCRDHRAPLDFLSWHCYWTSPDKFLKKADWYRAALDRYGFTKTESILDEWNYNKGWREDFVYSLDVISGKYAQKGAAFAAAAMIDCQYHPIDMMMYYDAQTASKYNGLFESISLRPMRGYYAFYSWSRLMRHPRQVACTLTESVKGVPRPPTGDVRAVASRDEKGGGAVFVARFLTDDNVNETCEVRIAVPGTDLSGARCHLTDDCRCQTEVPPIPQGDGSVVIRLKPNAFALLEYGN